MEREGPTPEQSAIPEPLSVNFERIPKRLQNCNQFVVWQYAIVDDEIKKPPFNPRTGRPASVRTAATWGSFTDAQAAYATGNFAGIGIVLTPELGLVAVDI